MVAMDARMKVVNCILMGMMGIKSADKQDGYKRVT